MRLVHSLVVCTLVLACSACSASPQTAPPRSTSTPTTRASATTRSAPTTHDNLVATQRFSARLLHAVPMPRGAREWRDSPTAHYRHGTVGIGPSDATLTRTTWWTVPASATSFSNWLRAHAPHRLTADSDGGSVEAGGIWEDDQAFRASGSMTHTPAWVNFAFMRYGAGLVVRVDTFVGARFARTTLVPADTNSVTIRHTVRHLGPHARPHTTTRTVTGPAAVARLVGMVDHLPGAMTVPFVASCPGALVEESYRMTFAGPHGSYVAALPSTACWPRLVLLRDGLRSSPPLDPGRVFARTADRYLAQFANSS